MTAPVNQDGFGLAFLLAFIGLGDHRGQSVVGFRGWDMSFGPGPGHTGGKGLQLLDGPRFDQFVQNQLRHNGGHAVIAQPAGVNRGGNKIMSQTMHGQQGGHLHGIPEIIDKRTFGHGRAGSRFDGDDLHLFTADLVPDKGQGQTGKITSSPGATNDNVRVIADFLELFLGFQSDDGLMEQDVVQNTAQGIFAAGVGDGVLHGFTDGDTETSRRVRILFQYGPAGFSVRTGAGDTGRSPGIHHQPSVRFLIITDPDHVNFDLQPEKGPGKTQGASPLTGPGLGGNPFGP